MLQRYDAVSDELVELTQEWFNDFQRQMLALALHYKNNSPDNFAKFREKYILTGKVTENV